jgi:hypothetical protein
MRPIKNAIIRYGILAFAVCLLCVPLMSAQSGSDEFAPAVSIISLPDTSANELFASDGAYPAQTITQIKYYVRKTNYNVAVGTLPVTGGAVKIKSYEIISFKITGNYDGPKGTFAMMDWVSRRYPMDGVLRVDAATVIPAGSSGTLTPTPIWFAGNIGNYSYGLEFFGNKTDVFIPIYVNTTS